MALPQQWVRNSLPTRRYNPPWPRQYRNRQTPSMPLPPAQPRQYRNYTRPTQSNAGRNWQDELWNYILNALIRHPVGR